MGAVVRLNFNSTIEPIIAIDKSIDFLHSIYKEQGIQKGDYYFLNVSNKNTGTIPKYDSIIFRDNGWREEPQRYGGKSKFKKQVTEFFELFPMEQYDLYFTTSIFREKRRREINVKYETVKLIAVDLDTDFNLNKYKPYMMWESSKGSYQAIFKLGKTYEELEDLKKAQEYMQSKIGGDCTDLARVLRIPGTINHKPDRDKALVTYPKKNKNNIVTVSQEELDTVETKNTKNIELNTNMGLLESLLRQFNFNEDYIQEVLGWNPNDSYRSDKVFKLLAELNKRKCNPELAKSIILNTPYSVRYTQEGRSINSEIKRVYSKTEGSLNIKGVNKKKGEKSILGTLDPADFMTPQAKAKLKEGKKWIIDNMFSVDSVGLLQGNSKSYKTTISTVLAYMVATGKELFGSDHKVNETGNVLYLSLETDILPTFAALYTEHGIPDNKIKVIGPEQLGDFDLSLENTQRELMGYIEEVNPKLVIIDPLYLMSTKANINKENEIVPILKQIRELCTTSERSVLLINHFNRPNINNSIEYLFTLPGYMASTGGSLGLTKFVDVMLGIYNLGNEDKDINGTIEEIKNTGNRLYFYKVASRNKHLGYDKYKIDISLRECESLKVECDRVTIQDIKDIKKENGEGRLSKEEKFKLLLSHSEMLLQGGILKEFTLDDMAEELAKETTYCKSSLKKYDCRDLTDELTQQGKITTKQLKGIRGKSQVFKSLI